MNRTKHVLQNIFWGFINKFVLILFPFLIRTAILYILGTQYLGLSSLFTSILNVLNLTELGFGSALTYSMYKPVAENDTKRVCALLKFFRRCYRYIGVLVLLIGLIFLPFIGHFIKGSYPLDINIYILYTIYLSNTVLTYFMFAYRTSLLIANQRNDINSNIGTLICSFQNVIQLIFLLIFKNYYIYIIILPIFTVIQNLITAKVTIKLFPDFICKGELPSSYKKEIFQKVKGLIFQKIGSVVLVSADNIVISSFLGLNELAIYNNYFYIITALNMIMSMLSGSLIPSIGNSIVTESHLKNYANFRTFNFIYVWIVTTLTACILCLYQPFIRLWIGEEYLFPFPLVILLCVYFYTYKWEDMLHIYQEAAGIWWRTRYIPLVAAIVNISINLVLITRIGIAGVLLSTILSLIFVYDLGYSYVLFKYYFKSVHLWPGYLLTQLKYGCISLFSCGCTFLIIRLIKDTNILELMIKGIFCSVFINVFLAIIYCRNGLFKESISFLTRLKNYIKLK